MQRTLLKRKSPCGCAALLAGMLLLVNSMVGNAWSGQSSGSASLSDDAGSAGSTDAFLTLAVIGNEELDELRGGFEIAGLQMDIGATIHTYIDGIKVLESMIMLTSSGGSTALAGGHVSGDPAQTSLPGLQIVDAGGLAALGDQIPDQVDLGGLNGASGVILNDSKGFTAALHLIDRSQIVSALVNTASGRSLRQQVDVTVDIANFKQFQSLVHDTLSARALSAAISRWQ
jgi:hypothetical protein